MPNRLAAFAAALMLAPVLSAVPAAAQDDPHLWLEEVEGEAALDWVRAENARSLAVLEADPRFAALYDEAKTILTSEARIPYGEIRAGMVWNFWQDAAHVRGVWRRASVESYRSGAPEWETVLDFDALAEAEGRNWIHGEFTCLAPDHVKCMVEMSDGGKDAAIWREFDTSTKSFVDGGFFIPEAKTGLAWVDADTLLVGTDMGEGSLTTSGYARTLRLLPRGTALADAPVVFEGEATDVSVQPVVEQDDGAAHVFYLRVPSFFERDYHYLKPGAEIATRLPLPPNADLEGVLDGRAIVVLREDWSHGGRAYPSGAIIAYDLARGEAELVMAPAANQSIEDVGVGKSNLVVAYLEDVSGKAVRLVRDRKKPKWSAKPIGLPANGVVSITSAGGGTDDAMLSFESLTVPDTLHHVDARNRLTTVASTPAFYDAGDVVVEQRFATSADGTKVPYFIMARKDVLEAGDAPTVQYGYGGFLAATLPLYYSDPGRPQHGALAGKMWVSRGGVLVLSNIRGGSEYGPRWHQEGLKANRQKVFDDFIAISEDLIARGVTSPAKLGAVGRSNGGLLMGALLTQRPELYAALDIGVPLLDMKRYNKLLAGASWMAEYGDPDTDDWIFMSQWSPYQLLEAGKPYPKVLLYTSTKDDRVHPGHARKAAAKLKALGYDYFYYENIEGGHGGTANQDQLAYRTALEFAYFAHQLMPAGPEGE